MTGNLINRRNRSSPTKTKTPAPSVQLNEMTGWLESSPGWRPKLSQAPQVLFADLWFPSRPIPCGSRFCHNMGEVLSSSCRCLTPDLPHPFSTSGILSTYYEGMVLWCSLSWAIACNASIPYWSAGSSSSCSASDLAPVNVPGKAEEEGPSTWAPATHPGNPAGISGSWLWPGPVLSHCSHLRGKSVEGRSFSLPLCL